MVKRPDCQKKKLPESSIATHNQIVQLEEAGLQFYRLYCLVVSDQERYYFIPLETPKNYWDLMRNRKECVWSFSVSVKDGVIGEWSYQPLFLPYYKKNCIEHTIAISGREVVKLKLKGVIPADLYVLD